MFFFFKQKTAYEMRISDWSSDVCSSDLTIHVSFYAGDQVHAATSKDGVSWQAGTVADVGKGANLAGRSTGIAANDNRSEERRVGKECVSKCRSRWSPYHSTKTTITTHENLYSNILSYSDLNTSLN